MSATLCLFIGKLGRLGKLRKLGNLVKKVSGYTLRLNADSASLNSLNSLNSLSQRLSPSHLERFFQLHVDNIANVATDKQGVALHKVGEHILKAYVVGQGAEAIFPLLVATPLVGKEDAVA